MGINVMAQFVEGNEYQAAIEASTDIYKRAKLLSLAYEGSSDSLDVSLPEGYYIRIGDSVTAFDSNNTALSEPLNIRGVPILSDRENLSGQEKLEMIYENGEIRISW
jgi:hypothetical protein